MNVATNDKDMKRSILFSPFKSTMCWIMKRSILFSPFESPMCWIIYYFRMRKIVLDCISTSIVTVAQWFATLSSCLFPLPIFQIIFPLSFVPLLPFEGQTLWYNTVETCILRKQLSNHQSSLDRKKLERRNKLY